MAVRVAKVHAASAVPVVELTIVEPPRCAAISEPSLPNAAEDGIELGIADVEGVVVPLELLVVVEEECERGSMAATISDSRSKHRHTAEYQNSEATV
jgi:hypothetical protein